MAFTKGKTKPAKGGTGGGTKDYDDTNRGVLFTNDKDGNESRPDYTGHVFINPEEYEVGANGLIKLRLAGWLKESEKVGPYLSLAASPPQAE
jgi:hypothetical protein